ncbi:hypothetical protein Agabi119p4_5632 [Agaricus bisporus var. burnettii]|uniref:NACHT domain-containing protein n=1 Tax=Agaricus bisporus var. burnettii TaxID=192524 RepID=A0A8H7F295_AGABI|nr:hypothetical protein Agabi119p4_5632 [Agaricus bisporus var. burnettii]
MSHNSTAARSSRLPPRYAPYSRFPTPGSSTRRSPLASPFDAGRPSYLSPAHPYSIPDMNSATGYSADPPSLNAQPTYTIPSTSSHQPGHSTYQAYSFPHPPAQVPFSQGPYHPVPATDTRYPALIHPPTNFQPVQPSIAIHQPDQDYVIYQHQHRLHTIQPEQVVSQQGQAYYGKGMFNRSQNLSFSDNTFIDNSITSEFSDIFMKEFLQHTIIGAEFDSSDRHPPPQCHPGTRLAIIERCKNFIVQCNGKEKMRWVVGGAGVGKSAIMQIVAEEIPADASVFFSVNGRNDGTKFFLTIAYQLAVKYEPYRQFIRNAINRDPSLLRKSLPAQFRKFIVDPFIDQHLFNPSQRFVIIIDGLDECDNPKTQREILGLISDFCIKYSASPVAWFVASRPEPHITSFFDNARVTPAYTKEEVEIDSDEACEDVQRYLRDELNKIRLAYPTLRHKREWPSGLEFTKIATAAGGLFAYASTVVRYIGNSYYRDPVTLLCRVLEAIDEGLKGDVSRKDHPMVLLDALYRRILDNIPPDVMIDTRKLLLTVVDGRWKRYNFRRTCNRLGLSEAAAYGAVSYLHAVLKVPAPDNADGGDLEFFHKSFPDFLLDFERSGFSHYTKGDSDQLRPQCSLRIVTEVSDDFVDEWKIKINNYGFLRICLGFCGNISLSWPGDERFRVSDSALRLQLYCDSMDDICGYFIFSCNYSGISFFHALTTRFDTLGNTFPIYSLRRRAFEEFRPELTELGKLKEVPLRTLSYAAICGRIDVCFTTPIGMNVKHLEPWDASCRHAKVDREDVNDMQGRRSWTTHFERPSTGPGAQVTCPDIPWFTVETRKHSHLAVFTSPHSECLYCSWRLACHFVDYPDQLATVFVDSTELCYVQLSFVDPDDGVSEWRYRFFHSGPPSAKY